MIDGSLATTAARVPPREGGRRVDGFDGLRACAALLVVAYHAASVTRVSLAGPLAPVAAELKAGVAIFFVISGFLLYLPYARAIRSKGPAVDWRQFARRRAARILPGYWVALTLVAAASLITGVLGPQWWRFYSLAQIYDPHTLQQGLRVAWSLSVELSFYLVLPFFAWGVRRSLRARSGPEAVRVQLRVLGGVALFSLAMRWLMTKSLTMPVPPQHLVLSTSIPAMADWFALGMGLAVLRVEWEAGSAIASRLRALANRPGLCWLLAALAYTLGVPVQHGEYFLPTYGVATHLFIGLASALIVLPAVLPAESRDRSRTMSLLSGRTLTWVGTISFGIYLWHVPFRDVIDRWLGAPRGPAAFALVFVLTLAGGVLLGAASWYLVERPAQAWIRGRHRLRVARRTGQLAESTGVQNL
ncbi:MAG: acyltransferase family protein [Solirubrobacteraceae bacterium]